MQPHSLAAAAAPAEAQTRNPLSNQWWPSPGGPQDRRGAHNRITLAKVRQAAALIKTGKVYALGRVLERGIPVFGERLGAHIVIPGSPTGRPFGDQKRTGAPGNSVAIG